jgi:hypothetical protein
MKKSCHNWQLRHIQSNTIAMGMKCQAIDKEAASRQPPTASCEL